VDCIIDAVGKRGTLDRYLPALCPDGTVGIYGIDELADQVVTPRLAPGSFTYYNGGYDEAETHDMVVGFVREGRLDASCWLDVSSAFCLSSLADALAAVRERKAVKALVNLEC
jgi:threonine dehydrogenase-like Zn-dependent dehydrogenase